MDSVLLKVLDSYSCFCCVSLLSSLTQFVLPHLSAVRGEFQPQTVRSGATRSAVWRASGRRRTAGCWEPTERTPPCSCTHLTNFAVLMAHVDVKVETPQTHRIFICQRVKTLHADLCRNCSHNHFCARFNATVYTLLHVLQCTTVLRIALNVSY